MVAANQSAGECQPRFSIVRWSLADVLRLPGSAQGYEVLHMIRKGQVSTQARRVDVDREIGIESTSCPPSKWEPTACCSSTTRKDSVPAEILLRRPEALTAR